MNIRKRKWTWQGEKRAAWRLDWSDHSGRHQKQFKTKLEAELYRDNLIRQRHARDYGVLLGPITFAEFLTKYREKKIFRTETYRQRVEWSIKALARFNMARLDEITPEMVEDFRDARLKDTAPATVRQDLAALADICKVAIKLHYLRRNPCVDVERPSLPVKQDDPASYMTAEDFGDLIAEAGKDRPLYELAVWTGLRESELLTLEWPDIRDGHLLVRKGKGRKQRLVPLLPQALQALRRVPKRLGDQRVFWWIKTRWECYKRFRRRLKWAELDDKHYTFHHLRHSFGALASEAGVDLRVIGAVMGHSSVSTTERLYAHLSPQYKRNELAKMATRGTRTVQQSRKIAKSKEG